MKRTIIISLFMLLATISLTAVTQAVDFNNTSDLNTLFDNPYPADVVNVSGNGIGGSGSVSMPSLPMYQTRVVTHKTGFHITELNEPILVSAYIMDNTNGGYAGIGFSSASSNTASEACHIINTPAIGMQFYSSGASFFNNLNEVLGGTYIPDIPFSWYKLDFTMIPRVGNVYDLSYQLYRANSNGDILALTKSGSTSVTNPTIANGLIYPYFGIDGHRVTYIDNFSVTHPDDSTLPVTMSSFTATAMSQTLIKLQWTTESESNILGFNIYRSDDAEITHALKLNASFIEGTNTSTQHTYQFADNEFEPNSTYYYWVESTELDNSSSFYGPVSVATGGEGQDTAPPINEGITGIVNVFPNPFSPNTAIAYQLKNTEDVTIGIYNQKGQLIRTLVKATKDSGSYRINWDGKDSNGNNCATGIYLARMQAGSANSFYKMTLVK